MTGKIRIEHSTPATGSPTQDLQRADEYLVVTKHGNEIMVAYSHEEPEDATPMLMEAANLLGRFNQVRMASQAMNARAAQRNQQRSPAPHMDPNVAGGIGMSPAHGAPYGQGQPNPQAQGDQPMTTEDALERAKPVDPPYSGPEVDIEGEVEPSDVERELDSY